MTTVPGGAVVSDPITVTVALVRAVEHGLDNNLIHDVVTAVAVGRAKRRRLAQTLSEAPDLLVTGGPPVPRAVGQLLLGLRKAGATSIAAPCCGDCGRAVTYLASGREYLICSVCRDTPQTCANCGTERRVSTRDRHGRPRCERCPDLDDPMPPLTQLVADIDPALTAAQVLAAVERATTRPAGRRRLAWAVIEHPDLLTGSGNDAPTPAVLRFINDLAGAGSGKVVRPVCARCHQVKALSKLLEGKRVCRNCFAKTRAVACCRCGSVREPATRDADGGPLCPNCLVHDPINLEDCTSCGRRRRTAVRTTDGPICQNCHQPPMLTCGICGRTAPCEISRATARPWCARCQKRWMRCSGCSIIAPLRGGTLQGPLCARCVNPDPDFWDRCPTCRVTWTLRPRTCQRCALDARIRLLLGADTGHVRDDLVPLHQALAQVDRPDTAMTWLNRPKVAAMLTEIGQDSRRLTHEILDDLPSSKTLDHLRSVLMATGTLPERDERLVKLERWTAALLATRTDPDRRRILHAYAHWHHLRRLRQRLGGAHASHLQCLNIRRHITAAADFLDWLAARDLTLASCTQPDLDQWASGNARHRIETGHFVRWSVAHRHARRLTFGTVRWEGPTGPHDSDKGWDDARQLLHDDTLKTSDRVVGLLLLLYAQDLSAVSRLTTHHVHVDDGRVSLQLGDVPVVLPEPLAALVLDLVSTRRASTIIDTAAAIPWLFPGRLHGQPLSPGHLGERLKKIGIQPGLARSTALFTLATELPAAILARMLGIHIKVAVAWQHASSGDWMTYAADVSQRNKDS